MPGILPSELPLLFLEHLQHVAVSDLGAREGNPHFLQRALQREIGHQGSGNAFQPTVFCAFACDDEQELVNVRVAKGFDWQNQPAIAKAKNEAERALGKDGRVLLRPSGTEPVLRVMVEGKDDAEVRRLARMIAETVQEAA